MFVACEQVAVWREVLAKLESSLPSSLHLLSKEWQKQSRISTPEAWTEWD
jgi:hypothetical protein